VDAATGSDSNTCLSADSACATINGAIADASGATQINVAAGTYSDALVFSNGQDITITGAGTDSTTIEPSTARPVEVDGGTVEVDDVTLNGVASSYVETEGGLAYINGGVSTFDQDVFEHGSVYNVSDPNSGNNSYGGDVEVAAGETTFTADTLENGVAETTNAGIAGGGLVALTGGTADFARDTIGDPAVDMSAVYASSSEAAYGGDVYIASTYTADNTPFVDDTITDGTIFPSGNAMASDGGNVYDAAGTTFLQDTITGGEIFNYGANQYAENLVSGTSATRLLGDLVIPGPCDGGVTATSTISDSATCGDEVTSDGLIELGSLASNGGPTQTEALPSTSIARDHVDPSRCAAVDQRGVSRAADIAANGNCDAGAYEEYVTPTSTALTFSPSSPHVGADVTATATISDASTPAIDGGTVTFTDGNSNTVCSDVVATASGDGTATATCDLGSGLSAGSNSYTAAYSGNDEFLSSSDTESVTLHAVVNPTITGHVASAHAVTSYGWYRSNVTVSFTCTDGSAPLTAACPSPVMLTKSQAAQSVSRTVQNQDGGTATSTVSPINIDKIPPVVSVVVKKHMTSKDKIAVSAHDALSGIASRTSTHTTKNGVVHYRVTATDKAGNRTVKTCSYRVSNEYFLAGLTEHHGVYDLRRGHTYTFVAIVATRHAPRYLDAAGRGTTPHPAGAYFRSVGTNTWHATFRFKATTKSRSNWVIGVRVNGHIHLIKVHVTG
jgi:hypothetical protein